MVQWLKLPAWKVGIRGFEPHSGLQVSKKQNISSPLARKNIYIVGRLCDREVACSVLYRQGSNFESCVWRAVSSHSPHHPQEIPLVQFSLYVRRFLHNHRNIITERSLKPTLCPTLNNLKVSSWYTKECAAYPRSLNRLKRCTCTPEGGGVPSALGIIGLMT